MRKFRICLIGCGSIYPLHMGALKENDYIEITAVCDIDINKAEKVAANHNCSAFSDYKQMIDRCKPDAVHILTPHYLHAPMAIYSLEHGVNVLTEKPMSISFADAESMVKAAEKSKKTLGVIFQNRYNTASTAVKSELLSGKLGKILGAKFNVFWYRDEKYYKSGDWRGKWETEGGGALINQSIHTLDLVNWFVDSPPLSVSASMQNRTLQGVIEVEDEASGIIKYNNGVSVSFFVCNHSFPGSDIEIEIFCENGKAQIIGNHGIITYKSGEIINVLPDDQSNKITGKDYWGTSHSIQINKFYEALSKGESPEIDGAEALKTQKIMCAIYESAKSNKIIDL